MAFHFSKMYLITLKSYAYFILGSLIVFSLPTTLSAIAWSSKNAPLFETVHQIAIQKALEKHVTAANLEILQQQQIVVDNDQEAAESYKHAMTGVEETQTPENQKPIYIQKAEAFVQENLKQAISHKKSGTEPAAFVALGKALHVLTDSTSPVHEGFQPWYYNESISSKATHVYKERVYPTDGTKYSARLIGSVLWAYDIYLEKIPIPNNFFDSTGVLQIPAGYP